MYCSAQSHTNGNWNSHSFQPYFQILLIDTCHYLPASFSLHLPFFPGSSLAMLQKTEKSKENEKKQLRMLQQQLSPRTGICCILWEPLNFICCKWDGTRPDGLRVAPAPQIFSLTRCSPGNPSLENATPLRFLRPTRVGIFVCPSQRFTDWTFCVVLVNRSCLLDLQACGWTPWHCGFLQHQAWGQQPAFLTCGCFPLSKQSGNLLRLALYPDRPQLGGEIECDQRWCCWMSWLLELSSCMISCLVCFSSAVPSRNPFWPATYKMSLWVREEWP